MYKGLVFIILWDSAMERLFHYGVLLTQLPSNHKETTPFVPCLFDDQCAAFKEITHNNRDHKTITIAHNDIDLIRKPNLKMRGLEFLRRYLIISQINNNLQWINMT